MFDADTAIDKVTNGQLRGYAESCTERLRNLQATSWRELLPERRHSTLRNFCRGFASVNLFGAPIRRSYSATILSASDAIANDWYMIGNDLCSAILEFDISRHGRSPLERSESEPTSVGTATKTA